MIQHFVSRTCLRFPSTSVYSRSPANNLHRLLHNICSSAARQSARPLPLPAFLQARTSTGGYLYSGHPAPTGGASSERRHDSRVHNRRVHQQARRFAISANNSDNPPPVMEGETAGAPPDAVDTERSSERLESPTVEDGPSKALEQQRNPEGDNVPVLTAPCTAAQLGFKITGEVERYSRWMVLYDRTVQFPAHGSHPAQEHDFDVVGHPRAAFSFVVVFPFHPHPDGAPGGEVTLLREYSQGVNEMKYVLPTGAYDPARHTSPTAAGEAELSEEARLKGGTWTSLLPEGHPGVPEVKWCRNRMLPFLCVGPSVDASPGAREAEEFIEVHRVSISELRRLMRSGEMMLPSVSTCAFALDELHTQGII